MPNTAIDLRSRPRLARRTRLQADPVTGEPVLLYPEGLLKLNPTAHEIVALCDGERTVVDLVSALAEEYDAPAERLQADVLECLADLHRQQLIDLVP